MDEQLQRLKVLGAGIFSLMLALGVARFAYTPLLPLMQAQAGLGLAEAARGGPPPGARGRRPCRRRRRPRGC